MQVFGKLNCRRGGRQPPERVENMATKMTIRLTTDKSKEYVDGIVRCMIGDYIHGHLTGLAVSVTGNEGNYHIRRGKKRTGCRPFPKELKIPEFMQKPRNEAIDAAKEENLQIPDFIKYPITCAEDAKGKEFLVRDIGGGARDAKGHTGSIHIWAHENA